MTSVAIFVSKKPYQSTRQLMPASVEALNGTLRAARRQKVITFEGQMLLQGVNDNVDVILLQDE
jgi:Costars